MIFLDTDVLIEVIDKKSKRGDEIVSYLKDTYEEIVTSSLNLEEILFGVFKRKGITALPPTHPLLTMTVLPFEKSSAMIAARIETAMESIGKKKPRGDVMIASVAIEHATPLFTLNVSHFSDIPELELVQVEL